MTKENKLTIIILIALISSSVYFIYQLVQIDIQLNQVISQLEVQDNVRNHQ